MIQYGLFWQLSPFKRPFTMSPVPSLSRQFIAPPLSLLIFRNSLSHWCHHWCCFLRGCRERNQKRIRDGWRHCGQNPLSLSLFSLLLFRILLFLVLISLSLPLFLLLFINQNLSARLMAACEWGSVMCDKATFTSSSKEATVKGASFTKLEKVVTSASFVLRSFHPFLLLFAFPSCAYPPLILSSSPH